jgi:hypothetical protein
MRSIAKWTVCTVILFFCMSFTGGFSAQEQPAVAGTGAKTSAPARKAANASKDAPKITADQRLAFDLLETSEAASRGFEAPMRSYGLLQVGSSFTTIDPAKARSLLRDSFTASLSIQDDDDTKNTMQEEIFRTLLPLSQSDVEELLPQAEMKVRTPVSEIIVSRYGEKKQFDKALELINQLSSQDEFPYGSGVKLMEAMPPEMAAEKQTLFTQAISSYKNHEHSGLTMGEESLTYMVTRFGLSMPPKLVIQAIEEILSQARANTEQSNALTVAGSGGSASFTSAYQFQLFALLPLLQQLDESRAKQLLDENQDLQAKLQQYPQGLSSVIPQPQPGNQRHIQSTATFSLGKGNGQGPGPGQRPAGSLAPNIDSQKRVMRDAEMVGQEGEDDPAQAIAHSMTLPVKLGDGGPGFMSPRAEALESIARANVKKNPAGAGQALSELRKIAGDIPGPGRARYLAATADLYLQMDEKANAEKTIAEGFAAAAKLLESDLNPDNPNTGLKAWWPSADAYRRFIEIEAKISSGATMNSLKEVKDPEIQATESIMFARSLLGLPLKRSRVVEKRKDKNMVMVNDIN